MGYTSRRAQDEMSKHGGRDTDPPVKKNGSKEKRYVVSQKEADKRIKKKRDKEKFMKSYNKLSSSPYTEANKAKAAEEKKARIKARTTPVSGNKKSGSTSGNI